MQLEPEQVNAFRVLEEQLWIAETRGDPAWMDDIIAPHFTEHGASGRIYDRQTIIDAPMPDHIPVELPLPDFAARAIAATTVLVTYTSIVDDVASNRASVWSHNGEQWQLEFHQGTPAFVEVEFGRPDLLA